MNGIVKELVAAVCLLMPFTAPAQQAWERAFGGTGNDLGRSVCPAFDGGYVVGGLTYSFGAGDADAYFVKVDSAGDTAWTRTYGGTRFDNCYHLAATSDSGCIATGSTKSFGAGQNDVYLLKVNSSGDTAWARTYGGTNIDQGNSVVPLANGGYFVAGWTMSYGSGPSDVYVVRTGVSGDTVWTRTYGGPAYDYSHSVCQGPDGGFFIVGWTNSYGAGSYDVYVVRTDSLGDTVWTRTYGGTSEDYGIFVIPTEDSGCVIAGLTSSFGAGGYDVYLVRTDAHGDTVWTRTYGSPSADWGYCVAPCSDSGFIVAAGWSSQSSARLLKTDANGDTTWTRAYGGSGQEEGLAVIQAGDDGFMMTGLTTSYGAGGQDVYVVKTGPDGVAVSEGRAQATRCFAADATVVRGALFLAQASSRKPQAASLLDAVGRRVLNLEPGTNDVSHLSPGVYFVRSADGGERSAVAVRRVILQR